MSIRNWVYIASIVGLIFSLAGTAHAQPVDKNAGNHQATGADQDEPNDGQEPVWLPSVQSVLNRIAGAIEAGNNKSEAPEDRERANRDLQAQVDMAKWAKWMIWIGVGEAAITLVGVILVWRTLVHTRDAARYAGEAAKAAADQIKIANQDNRLNFPPKYQLRRPIVHKPNPLRNPLYAVPDFVPGETIRATAWIINTGRVYGEIVSYDLRLYWAPLSGIPMNEAYHESARFNYPRLPAGRDRKSLVLTILTEVPHEFSSFGEWSHTLYMIGGIHYTDGIGQSRGYHFCKRYLPDQQRFEDCPEYESED